MRITPNNAIMMLGIALDIALKVKSVIETGKPTSIEEELIRLENARLRPSEDIIEEADKDHPIDSTDASGGGN